MSKVYQAEITCPRCAVTYDQSLFQTLWIEDPANRSLVFEDKVNWAKCPQCGFEVRVLASLMCTNVPRKFAVWFEPQPSKHVDEMAKQFADMMGPTSFYATAPRIADWADFKRVIERFESGELKGGDARFDVAALRRAVAETQPRKSLLKRLFGKD
jgi:hypothetical protein